MYTNLAQQANSGYGMTNLALATRDIKPIISSHVINDLIRYRREAIITLAREMPRLQADLKPVILQLAQNRAMLETVRQHTVLATAISQAFNQSAIESLRLNLRFVTELTKPQETTDIIPAESSDLLTVTVDQYGAFEINGQPLSRANSRTSQYGKLLKLFEDQKGSIVTKSEIREYTDAKDHRQVLKDLKKQLGLQGYVLKVKPYPSQGWVYSGIVSQQ